MLAQDGTHRFGEDNPAPAHRTAVDPAATLEVAASDGDFVDYVSVAPDIADAQGEQFRDSVTACAAEDDEESVARATSSREARGEKFIL